MELSIFKDQLTKAINTVINAKPIRTTKDILEGILIQTNKDHIKLTAYDYTLSIEYTVECSIIEEGATVINASVFSEIIKKLPDTLINIKLISDNLIQITCEGSEFKLNTMNPLDYPELPKLDLDDSKKVEVEQDKLKNAIRKTIFATSTEETKQIYQGELFKIHNNNLEIVALDGCRLAIRQIPLLNQCEDFEVVIHSRTLNEVAKILNDSSIPIKFGALNNQAIFEMENCRIITKLIDGKFNDYKKAIPTTFTSTIKINKNELLNSFERINLLQMSSGEKEKRRSIKVQIDIDRIILSCINQIGNGKEEIFINTEGRCMVVGFNARFFIDALKAIEDEEILLEFTSNIQPCIIRAKNKVDYCYLILPVKLSSYEA